MRARSPPTLCNFSLNRTPQILTLPTRSCVVASTWVLATIVYWSASSTCSRSSLRSAYRRCASQCVYGAYLSIYLCACVCASTLTLPPRLFEAIQKWIKSYEGVIHDPQALALYHQWISRTPRLVVHACLAHSLWRAFCTGLKPEFDEEMKMVEELPSLVTPPPKPSTLRFVTSTQPMQRIQSILQLEPDDIAIQLTLYEFDLLKVPVKLQMRVHSVCVCVCVGVRARARTR